MGDTNALRIIAILEELYPDALCGLEYEVPWQLLLATRLAAQCKDQRVNKITPVLFAKYPTLEALAAADVTDVEEIIHSCGFYHAKARDLIGSANMLITDFGGTVPDTMEQLLKLPGVGRKTANIILGDIYGKPAVVTDTHCIRLANRMGLTKNLVPYKVEMDLAAIIPPEKQSDFCHRLVLHGRAVCNARKPKCAECAILPCCAYNYSDS
ncbi:MAG: endonuclease III [Oscillospiraceae bacterium]|jgi:endonuclease-3|nr:endonuclease III [Oscillospiraceae bacterium]